jgi:hypothetical protein
MKSDIALSKSMHPLVEDAVDNGRSAAFRARTSDLLAHTVFWPSFESTYGFSSVCAQELSSKSTSRHEGDLIVAFKTRMRDDFPFSS